MSNAEYLLHKINLVYKFSEWEWLYFKKKKMLKGWKQAEAEVVPSSSLVKIRAS